MIKKKVAETKGAESTDKEGGEARKASRGGRPTDVGRALRTVYDETLREDVPDDFLDLLGKLS